jgi:hypothetical protein
MSYDFWVEVRADAHGGEYIEPLFSDQHPALGSGGLAGTALVTKSGRSRCGNYTSNVSGMWTRCLTAALERVPEARRFADDDARRFNAAGRTTHRFNREIAEWERNVKADERTGELCLRDLADKPCGEIAAVLAAAVEWGVGHLDELRRSNPENGWGNAEGAVTYLWDIQRMCEAHPGARLRISS